MNTNAGTLQFFAPEQSGMEDSKVTTAVDIYGFAGVAIDCLTGLYLLSFVVSFSLVHSGVDLVNVGVAPWTGKDFKYIMGALFAGRTPPELELVADKSVCYLLLSSVRCQAHFSSLGSCVPWSVHGQRPHSTTK